MGDVQLMLGLSQEEVANLLLPLENADNGHLTFVRGNIYLRFQKENPWEKNSKIKLKVSVIGSDIVNRTEYTIPRAFIRLAKKKSLGITRLSQRTQKLNAPSEKRE